MGKAPVRKFKHGRVTAAIWQKEQDGETFYDVQLNRSYKDKHDEWQTTDNFSLFDVFAAIRALCDAAAYLTIPDVNDSEAEAVEVEG